MVHFQYVSLGEGLGVSNGGGFRFEKDGLSLELKGCRFGFQGGGGGKNLTSVCHVYLKSSTAALVISPASPILYIIIFSI